jgi:putative transcriptional regulator
MRRAKSTKAGIELIEAMREVVDHVRGKIKLPGRIVRVPDDVEVVALRRRLGLSQRAFAARFGFSLAAVRDWEQGRRRPEKAARVLLMVIARDPKAVDRALSAA